MQYVGVLRPEDYVFAYDTTKSARELYEMLEKQQAQKVQEAENVNKDIGKSEILQLESTEPESTSSRSWAAVAAATGAEADAYV